MIVLRYLIADDCTIYWRSCTECLFQRNLKLFLHVHSMIFVYFNSSDLTFVCFPFISFLFLSSFDIWFNLFIFWVQVSVSQICFYLDFNLDDSYTPKKVSIRSGTSSHDLIDVTAIELNEPVGNLLILFIFFSLCVPVSLFLFLCFLSLSFSHAPSFIILCCTYIWICTT